MTENEKFRLKTIFSINTQLNLKFKAIKLEFKFCKNKILVEI